MASQGPCQKCVTNFGKIIFITLSLLLSFILNMSQRLNIPKFFKNVGRQHDIRFKIKIFAKRYPFFIDTNMKIAFLADFENDGWKETKYMDQKAGSIAVVRWTSMRLSL